jgi:hypothetical protein
MGDEDGLEAFFRYVRGFFKDFLGADFQADIAAFAPFLVEVDGCGLLLFSRTFFQFRVLLPFSGGEKSTASIWE